MTIKQTETFVQKVQITPIKAFKFRIRKKAKKTWTRVSGSFFHHGMDQKNANPELINSSDYANLGR